MLLSVNLEVFWNLPEWLFLPFCCSKRTQLLFFVFFFLPSNPFGSLPLCRGMNVHSVCAICSEKTLKIWVPWHIGLCALSLWPWKWEHWDMRSVSVGSLRPVSLVSLVFPPEDDEGGFWRAFEYRWQKGCNGRSQGVREGQEAVLPGRAQGSMNCIEVQHAAGFLGGSGTGKLKVTVITLPESPSWPQESIYKHYKKLLFCSEKVHFTEL